MDPYDSDSSGFDDEGDFTETGVLLGYGSEEILDDTISHLGGWPTWLDDATPPPGDFANCKVCNRPMLLLLELHGDLPEHFPHDERRLYIFGCPRKACNKKPGSVRALRATRKLKIEQAPRKTEEKPQPEKPTEQVNTSKQDLGASLFGGTSLTGSISASQNPFSPSNVSSAQASNPFAIPSTTPSAQQSSSTTTSTNALAETFADKVRISSPPPTTKAPESSGPPAPWPEKSAFPTPYPHLYLDAEYETLSRSSTPLPANVTVDTTEEEEPAGGSSAEPKDSLESELDLAFIRFSTRLAHNPEQILRYQFRGSPLLYSYTDAVGKRLHDAKNSSSGSRVTTISSGASRFPRCEYCGSERTFELQLVPHAISLLEDGREGVGLGPKDDAGMEWGTIILAVCSKDCGSQEVNVVGWREEWAGVQWEEEMK